MLDGTGRGPRPDLELLATEVRRRAGLTDDDNELATTIAGRLLGEQGLAVDETLRGAAYLRRRSDGGYQIVIRPSFHDVRWAVSHELGHYAIREIARAQMPVEAEEHAANYLAAAILAPPRAVRRAHAHYGAELRHLRPIARTFGLSQTATQLRLGEVLGDKRAVVTKRSNVVLSRGSGWMQIPAIEIARGKAKSQDIARATLRGGIDEGRVALHRTA